MKHESRQTLLGVAYLVVIALFIGSSAITYSKSWPWQNPARVDIVTRSAGLELKPLSDVKFQGVRVGEVRSISSDGRSATIGLAIDRDKLAWLPANVDAQIIPKTLFGEKFVSLQERGTSVTARLASGDRIAQSETSVEIGRVIAKLVPLLRAVDPAQMSQVLTELAGAVDGRGTEIGQVINQAGDLSQALSPQVDDLAHDLRQLAKTADVYTRITPEISQLLGSSSTISREFLTPQAETIDKVLTQIAATSEDVRRTLATNAQELVTLSGRAKPVLALLDEYSAALPCTVSGFRIVNNLVNQAMGARGPFVNLKVDVVVKREPYRGPVDLPSNPNSPANNANIPSIIPGWTPHCPVFSPEVRALRSPAPYSQPYGGITFNVTSSNEGFAPEVTDAAVQQAREALARAATARYLGTDQQDVPPYASLLLEPLLSDGEVEIP